MKKKIESIQALRAVAAFLVVIFHMQHAMEHKVPQAQDAWLNAHPTLATFGMVGVDIFFIISGLVMTLSIWNHFGSPQQAGIFLKRRMIRIYPIYWFYLLLRIIIFSLFATFVTSVPEFNLEKTLVSALLIPYNGPPVEGFSQHYALGLAWTLSFEMYFYILVTACLLFARKYFFPIVIAVFIGGIFLLSDYTAVHPLFVIFSSTFLLEFIWGILIGYAMRHKKCLPKIPAVLVSLVAPILLFMGHGFVFPLPQGMSVGIPVALLVYGIVSLEQQGWFRTPQILSKLGNSSYTLYLFHGVVQGVLIKLLTMSGLAQVFPADISILIITLACLPAAHLAYLLVEKPVTAFLNKKLVS